MQILTYALFISQKFDSSKVATSKVQVHAQWYILRQTCLCFINLSPDKTILALEAWTMHMSSRWIFFIQCKWPDKNDKNVALCGRNNFEYITNASNGQQPQKRVTNKPKISNGLTNQRQK